MFQDEDDRDTPDPCAHIEELPPVRLPRRRISRAALAMLAAADKVHRDAERPSPPPPLTPADRAMAATARKVARVMRERCEVVAAYLRTMASLGGLCHFAALGQTQALCTAGLPAFIASNGRHSWSEVELSTGRMMLDVTASQYGFSAVLVRLPGQPRPRRHGSSYYAAVSGLEAQKLCQEAADRWVVDAPPDWWNLDPENLPIAMAFAGMKLHTHARHWAVRGDPTPVVEEGIDLERE